MRSFLGRRFTHTNEFVFVDHLRLADATGATKHCCGLEEMSHKLCRLRPNAVRSGSVPVRLTGRECTTERTQRIINANIATKSRKKCRALPFSTIDASWPAPFLRISPISPKEWGQVKYRKWGKVTVRVSSYQDSKIVKIKC